LVTKVFNSWFKDKFSKFRPIFWKYHTNQGGTFIPPEFQGGKNYDVPEVYFHYSAFFQVNYDVPEVDFHYSAFFRVNYNVLEVNFHYSAFFWVNYNVPEVDLHYSAFSRVNYDVPEVDFRYSAFFYSTMTYQKSTSISQQFHYWIYLKNLYRCRDLNLGLTIHCCVQNRSTTLHT